MRSSDPAISHSTMRSKALDNDFSFLLPQISTVRTPNDHVTLTSVKSLPGTLKINTSCVLGENWAAINASQRPSPQFAHFDLELPSTVLAPIHVPQEFEAAFFGEIVTTDRVGIPLDRLA